MLRSVLPRVVFVALLAAVLLFPVTVAGQPDADLPVVRVILFHSPTCPYCRIVLSEILPPIQARYGAQLEVRLYDLSVQTDYQIFAALHEQNPSLPGGIPQLYIDNYVLLGSREIEQGLPLLIDGCLEKGGCDYPFTVTNQPAPVDQPAAADSTEPVYIAYCVDPTCLECDRVTYDLEYLQQRYPNVIVREFDVNHDAALVEAMCAAYDVPPDERLLAPALFIGDLYLPPEQITPDRLERLIATAAGAPPPWEGIDVSLAESSIIERFSGFSIPAVAAAGLLDGINPCAFTTIIFFMSYLALVGRQKHEILLVGAAFTLAVFLTYLLMGLGLSALVEQVGAVDVISRIIYGATALICIVLAGLSLSDYFKVRRGETSEIALQLPKRLKAAIHRVIRERSRMKAYIGAAFVTGMLVSIFELACTGQVYLPTIVFMTSVAEMRMTAVAYLVLYNIMFVVPLVVVFIVAYFGVSSQGLTAVFQAHVGKVKLFTTVLFLALGLWLGYLLIA